MRAFIRGEIANYLTLSGAPFPFYETINTDQSPTDDLWCTVEFAVFDIEHRCYSGTLRIERGAATITIFGKPGVGDSAVVAAADALQNYFDGLINDGDVVIANVLPATEATAGDATNFYGVEIELEYDYFN